MFGLFLWKVFATNDYLVSVVCAPKHAIFRVQSFYIGLTVAYFFVFLHARKYNAVFSETVYFHHADHHKHTTLTELDKIM